MNFLQLIFIYTSLVINATSEKICKDKRTGDKFVVNESKISEKGKELLPSNTNPPLMNILVKVEQLKKERDSIATKIEESLKHYRYYLKPTLCRNDQYRVEDIRRILNESNKQLKDFLSRDKTPIEYYSFYMLQINELRKELLFLDSVLIFDPKHMEELENLNIEGIFESCFS